MLSFDAGVACRVFHHEAAVVLHHASMWAAIAGATIIVIRLGEVPDDATIAAPEDYFVDLAAVGDQALLLPPLRDYLARTLGPEFLALLEPDRLHITWGLPSGG
jgi:hypothetical protein